jgi:hypothetical protein
LSHKAHRERELNVVITAFVAIDEILQEERNITHLKIAAGAQFARDVGGNIFRPMLGRVETTTRTGF